ncbi:hypothetical protein AC1031_009218 [Aphanomyces cochlioides]|nr:hypothetical protein AC1031_009218 [Aphanomyces cochlioides]
MGDDIGSTSRSTADLCCEDCKANIQCRAFVCHLGVCYLKSSAVSAIKSYGRRAGVLTTSATPSPIPSASGCSIIQENTDFADNDIGAVSRPTAEEC